MTLFASISNATSIDKQQKHVFQKNGDNKLKYFVERKLRHYIQKGGQRRYVKEASLNVLWVEVNIVDHFLIIKTFVSLCLVFVND